MKKHNLATFALSASMFAVVSAGAAGSVYASSSQSDAAHQLPILFESPSDTQPVKPNAPITIKLDPSSPNFNRFHEQFVKNSFTVLINNQTAEASYDDTTHTITVQHATLDRYTQYTVTLLVKAAANGNTTSGNASDSFSFETGSAIGEATNVTVTPDKSPVSVDSGGTLTVTATDDYGDHATNATVSVTGTGGFITPSSVQITDGSATVQLKDKTPETVTLSYAVGDNAYSDKADDTHSGIVSETFAPGAPASLTLAPAQSTAQAGTSDTVSGSVFDQYGNLATNDTDSVNVSVNGGTPTSLSITQGTFTYTLAPAGHEKAGTYTIQASDGNLENSTSVQVTPGPVDAKASLVTVDKPSITAGDMVTVSVLPEDQFNNPIGSGQSVSVVDGGSNFKSLDWDAENSDYEAQFTETKSLSTTFTASVGSTQLDTKPTVTVNPGTPDAGSSIVTFPTGSIVAGTAYTVTGTLEDKYGNVIPNQIVTLNFDGQTGTAQSGPDGKFSLSVTPTKVGKFAASVASGSVTLASTTGQITPGAATSIQLSPSSGTLAAGSTDTFTGTVLDAYGNTATIPDGTVVTLGSTTGTVPFSVTTTGGQFTFDLFQDTTYPNEVVSANITGLPRASSAVQVTGTVAPSSTNYEVPGYVMDTTVANTWAPAYDLGTVGMSPWGNLSGWSDSAAHWLGGTANANSSAAVGWSYYRHDIEVTQSTPLNIAATADNEFSMYVDGATQPVLTGSNWAEAYNGSITLEPGLHTIVVAAHNDGGPAGFIVSIKQGNNVLVDSSSGWYSTPSVPVN